MEKQQDFDDFVTRLKVAAKSDKPIWNAIEEIEEQNRQASKEAAAQERASTTTELERRRSEMKRSTGG